MRPPAYINTALVVYEAGRLATRAWYSRWAQAKGAYTMRVGVVGYGYVGKALTTFFQRAHLVFTYDKNLDGHRSSRNKENIAACDIVFVAVPTPITEDGRCDMSAVEEVVGWVEAPLCIKSTVIPGTVDRLAAAGGREMVFSPEYIGESPGHPWSEPDSPGFVIVGGAEKTARLVTNAYRSCAPQLTFHYTDARTAELCKYMENCFLATKVAFVNQFYEIAEVFGVSFEQLRGLWLLDTRVGESHTRVAVERGFGGRCLPKDMTALVTSLSDHGGAPLLEAVLRYNCRVRSNRATAAVC